MSELHVERYGNDAADWSVIHQAGELLAPGIWWPCGLVRDNPAVNEMVRKATALDRIGQPDDVGLMMASLLADSSR